MLSCTATMYNVIMSPSSRCLPGPHKAPPYFTTGPLQLVGGLVTNYQGHDRRYLACSRPECSVHYNHESVLITLVQVLVQAGLSASSCRCCDGCCCDAGTSQYAESQLQISLSVSSSAAAAPLPPATATVINIPAEQRSGRDQFGAELGNVDTFCSKIVRPPTLLHSSHRPPH